MTQSISAARQVCGQHQQEHLLAWWDRLDEPRRAELLSQIEALDWPTIERMRAELVAERDTTGSAAFEAADAVHPPAAEQAQARATGEAALRAGEVGVILVAGGQGTRLGFDAPKGTFAIGPLSGASLFEIHARKILAAERRSGCPLPFYIMTSHANDADTRRFFAERRFFGLDPARVMFFTQGMLPALWPDGRIVLESPSRIFLGPDGHGGLLDALRRTGMLDDMRRRGLATLFYFQVDNPLVEIAEPAFLGLHVLHRAQMSIKVCAKRDPEEGLGVIVRRKDRLGIVEYTDPLLTHNMKIDRRPNGDLLFKYGSVAIHVFARTFLESEADAGLPLHRAHKKVPYCDAEGHTVKPKKENAYKSEKFIFDALPDAERSLAVEFDREEEFSPVKHATGADSPETTRRGMMVKFARWLEACGVEVPRLPDGSLRYRIEIDPLYADNAAELRARLPAGFRIEGDTYLH